MKGIKTTLVFTTTWFPDKEDFPTDADLLEAAYHDAKIYQADPETFVTHMMGDAETSVTFSIVEE